MNENENLQSRLRNQNASHVARFDYILSEGT